jgi:rubredoxin
MSAVPFRRYRCENCGTVFDEALGSPEDGIAPGTRFADLPDDWYCPQCGAEKADFTPDD